MTNLECIEYASKHSFKGLYEKGREDVIDEFLKELYPCRYEYNDDCHLCGSFAHCMVFIAERIADKLKEKEI